MRPAQFCSWAGSRRRRGRGLLGLFICALRARGLGHSGGTVCLVIAPLTRCQATGLHCACIGRLPSAPRRRHHAAARVHPETAPQNQPPHGGHRAIRRDSPVLGGSHPSGQGNRSHPNTAGIQIPPLTLPRPQHSLPSNRSPLSLVSGLSLWGFRGTASK